MKQPIAGIAGLKPRAPKPEGDGRLSKQESRALDAEYRRQRNETLRLKNHREAMLLAKPRGELILRDLVERQAEEQAAPPESEEKPAETKKRRPRRFVG